MKYVYVVSQAKDICKIGMTTNTRKRIDALQTGNPFSLKLEYSLLVEGDIAMSLENRVHLKLNEKRMNGEWFNVTALEAKKAIDEESQIMKTEDIDEEEILDVLCFDDALEKITEHLQQEQNIPQEVKESVVYVERIMALYIDFWSIDAALKRRGK